MNRLNILFLLVAISCLPLRAQESADERIDKMEKFISKLPKMAGDINLRYRYDDTDGANGFDVRRARLDFRGNVIESLEYRVHLEFANGPKILDASVRWNINEHVAVQAGQYKIPFSLENPYNPNKLEMIDNALAITHLVNYSDVSDIAANGRDIGVSVIGNFLRRKGFNIIDYYFGVFNGSGINTGDANKDKDFSGMLSINPSKHLTFAVSHYNGTVGTQGDTFHRTRNGFGVKYDDNRLLVRSEYIHGKTGELNSDGAYAVCGYYVHPKVQTVARYDYFKRDLSDNSTTQQDYTVGVNYFPVTNVRLQFNYTRRTKNDINYTDNNYFVTQLWIRF